MVKKASEKTLNNSDSSSEELKEGGETERSISVASANIEKSTMNENDLILRVLNLGSFESK